MHDHPLLVTALRSTLRRVLALVGVAALPLVAVALLVTKEAAGSDTTATTIALADGSPVPTASGPAIDDLSSALGAHWPGAVVGGASELHTRRTSWTDVTGVLPDGSTFELTIYRRFTASELDDAELVATDESHGTTWVGAENEDLTSVYHRSRSGTGIRLGVTPARGSTAPAVESVAEDAQALAELPEVVALSR